MRHKSREILLPVSEEKEVDNDFISGYEGLVKRIVAEAVREVGDYALNFDDLFQEGLIALIDAKKTYTDTGEAKFSTYAYTVVKNRISKVSKYYSDIYTHEKSYSADPSKYEKLFADKPVYDFHSIVDGFIKKLNKKDKVIFEMYLQGMTYAEIATHLNTNLKKVDNRLCLIKKRLNKHYALLKKE